LNIRFYVILALAILFNALANITLKWGVGQGSPLIIPDPLAAIKYFAANVWVWLGIALFGLAFVLYSVVLTRINLSVAYPVMTSMGLVLISLVSVLVFHEAISFWQTGGMVLIVIGVWLVSAGI
jgi:multidrug transporter EmrE-like cation transporter